MLRALFACLPLACACAHDRDPPPAARSGGAADAPFAATAPNPDRLTFAVVGDYGDGSAASLAVGALVRSWAPDFVVTTGDNNYPAGDLGAFDKNVAQPYHAFLGGYRGAYGVGSEVNRFWPALGNHDWGQGELSGWSAFFDLPGNERYYDVDYGRVRIYVVDSDPREPDGRTATSVQGRWLQGRLAASTACHDLVFFHHPPYNSGGHHGSTPDLRWPFAAWGAEAVLAGHEHVYERLEVDGIPYFVNGIGGHGLYRFGATPLPESRVRSTGEYGAMRGLATPAGLTLEAWTVSGRLLDTFTQHPACPGGPR